MDITYKCVVLGSSGETGRELIKLLCSNDKFSQVVCLNRRKIYDYEFAPEFKSTKKHECESKLSQVIIDFYNLDRYSEIFQNKFDIAFCTLGSSLSKADKTEFEFIEKDLIVKCAKLFAEAGCQNFHLVTGAYSDPNSTFYIPRVKGQCEHEVSKIHTSLSSEEDIKDCKNFRSLTIYRPGLLRLADKRKFRREKSFRMMEWIARQFSDWFDLGDWWSIKTDDLAKVMIKRGISSQQGQHHDSSAKDITIMEHSEIVTDIPFY